MSWRELSTKVVDDTLELDVKGTLYCTHEFGRRMLDLQKSGVIVNVASNVIVTGSPRSPAYAAAKYGVIGVTKSYALALAPYVRVNTVAPGYMDTPSLRARKDWTDTRKKWIVDHTPLKSIGKPDNIAHIVVFLASQDSFHMSGNTIICDGGFSMPAA
jgi:3-oxoacyl-[acyl-carrier protein] reductase